jgi:uncharacterized protein (TIGR00255 family)
MIKSMTGFASVTADDETATVAVTIKSVNHRFLDTQVRLPGDLAAAEPRVRAAVQARVARGRVEVSVSVQRRQGETPSVELNEPFVRALREALDVARGQGLIAGPLTPGDLLRWPPALTVRERPEETDEAGAAGRLEETVMAAATRAVEALEVMRTREGAHLAADLDARVAGLAALIEDLAGAADEGREAVVARLRQRIAELGLDAMADPMAVAQEVVRAAGRADIAEEVTRFRAHLEHWRAITAAAEPCGRKLDFLLQEMNREVNTIGSKAGGPRVSDLVISAKVELERMREQVQNVE